MTAHVPEIFTFLKQHRICWIWKQGRSVSGASVSQSRYSQRIKKTRMVRLLLWLCCQRVAVRGGLCRRKFLSSGSMMSSAGRSFLVVVFPVILSLNGPFVSSFVTQFWVASFSTAFAFQLFHSSTPLFFPHPLCCSSTLPPDPQLEARAVCISVDWVFSLWRSLGDCRGAWLESWTAAHFNLLNLVSHTDLDLSPSHFHLPSLSPINNACTHA